MQAANVSSKCPTYYEINQVFPDNSNPKISGKLDFNDKGIFERQGTVVHFHYRYYDQFDKNVFWVDPPADVITRKTKYIEIAPNNFDYVIKSQQVLTNTSYAIGQNRYVDSRCQFAIITADNWVWLLGDTLQYLLSNCDRSKTNFNETKIIKWQATYHDITTSAKWKLEQWQKKAKELCSTKCGLEQSQNLTLNYQFDSYGGGSYNELKDSAGVSDRITVTVIKHISDPLKALEDYKNNAKPNIPDMKKVASKLAACMGSYTPLCG